MDAGDEPRANSKKMEILSMDRCTENVIEFLENQQQATVTFHRGDIKPEYVSWQRPGRRNVRLWQRIKMAVYTPIFLRHG